MIASAHTQSGSPLRSNPAMNASRHCCGCPGTGYAVSFGYQLAAVDERELEVGEDSVEPRSQ
jgi:hypothetical protein